MKKPGYHLATIPRGALGEVSKIREELEELEDAIAQKSSIMALVELSDLVGAIEHYLEKHHPGTTLADLSQFAFITKRAFLNGRRTAK